ncbi:MFS transporter [Pseudarthrobacter albicanus]|uniref:MFS transporter n=1 Tax=Pseudarthrobacter albicanus TaxID=2823873 RepID=UPI001BAC9ED8|nr:MFS transporter [Pseudarthrobacter albicanus]
MGEDSQPPTRLWTRNFVLAIVTNFFIAMVFYLLMTSMALYAVERFQASDSAAGFAASAFIAGSVVARLFAGRLLDTLGRRRVLLASLAVFVIASLLYLQANTLGLLLALRAVHGVAFGAGNTAIAAAVQALIPPARRSEGTGYFGLSATLATAVGPSLAIQLSPRMEGTRASSSSVPPAKARGMSDSAGIFFLLYAAAVLASRFFVGRIQDRRGDNSVMYPTLAFFALGLAMLALEPSVWSIGLAGILVGFGFGALLPCAQTIAVTAVPAARMGTGISTFYLMLDAGTGLGPVVLGALVPVLGYAGMYGALSLLMCAAVLLYFLVHGRRQRGPRRA